MFNIQKFNEIREILENHNNSAKIVAISKNHPIESVFEAISYGVYIFGENRVQEAKTKCDKLIVTITPDEYVNKGPGRPVFNHHQRAEALASLSCVDYVSINKWETAINTLSFDVQRWFK